MANTKSFLPTLLTKPHMYVFSVSPGSEMYMAFGVKEKNQGNTPAQGDVVVGWINSQTGRGGLDDYFLSGTHTCSDGAESCPDTSKPGGLKNVEMLNSVSRDNYTMITFRRSVRQSNKTNKTLTPHMSPTVCLSCVKMSMSQTRSTFHSSESINWSSGLYVSCISFYFHTF